MVVSTAQGPPPICRRAVLGALVVLAPGRAAAASCAPPNVLFVCPAGTVKSAIAREALRRRAAAAGVPVRVRSRGVDPQDHVSPALARRLRADGLDPAAEPLRRFSPGDLAGADIVIAFDEAAQVPALRSARAWIIPSWNADYDDAKAALAIQLDDLLDELRRRPCAGASDQPKGGTP